MNADELIKKSYDFAADLTKQMITLSTAIITLCVAFTGKLFTSESASANSAWLFWALIAFVCSIACGIFALMGFTGQLAKTAEPLSPQPTPQVPPTGEDATSTPPNNQNRQVPTLGIYNSTNRIISMVQIVTFLIGLVLAITYVYKASTVDTKPRQEVKSNGKVLHIIRQSTYSIPDSVKIDTLEVAGLSQSGL